MQIASKERKGTTHLKIFCCCRCCFLLSVRPSVCPCVHRRACFIYSRGKEEGLDIRAYGHTVVGETAASFSLCLMLLYCNSSHEISTNLYTTLYTTSLFPPLVQSHSKTSPGKVVVNVLFLLRNSAPAEDHGFRFTIAELVEDEKERQKEETLFLASLDLTQKQKRDLDLRAKKK